MATDWLHNAHAWAITSVFAAALCSLVLTLTCRRWPPTAAKSRVGRAIFIVICSGAASYLASSQERGESLMMALGSYAAGPFTFAGVRLLAIALAALFFGGLIPVVIERRTLAQMGWVGRRVVLYAAVALLIAIAFRLLAHPPPAGEELLRELDAPALQTDVFLRNLGLSFIAITVAEGLLVAFLDENLFRGHLMLSLRELGWPGRRANYLQAAMFAACHPYIVLLWAQAPRRADLAGIYLGLFLFGLLCGYMRWRTGSLVPGFVFHAVGNMVAYIAMLGPLAAFGARL